MAVDNILTGTASTNVLQWETIASFLSLSTTGDKVLSINKSSKVVSWQNVPTTPGEYSSWEATYAALAIDSGTDVLDWYNR